MDAEQKTDTEQPVNTKQKIIELIKIKGPVIPSQISKAINSDILMSSAHLSELSSEGRVKISSVKIGGTPLYYIQGQESQLQNFSDNLGEVPRKAFELLKENKILRDKSQEPAIRVALREIKDFAIPLQVTYQNNKEMFWKWYLLDKEETSSIIKSLLSQKEPQQPKKEIAPEKQEVKPEKKEIQKERPIQEKLIEKKPEPIKKEVKQLKPKSDFIEKLQSYFEENKINIKDTSIIRKNSEIDYMLEVPSAIGHVEFYCKAKNKKRISDSDLSSAFVQAQLKKLPALFLTKGELTKKAKDMLGSEFNIKIINF